MLMSGATVNANDVGSKEGSSTSVLSSAVCNAEEESNDQTICQSQGLLLLTVGPDDITGRTFASR